MDKERTTDDGSPITPYGAKGGKVFLIAAGPGDPELLTLKAVRALGSADVILIDALADRRVLAHARHGARVIEVGKRGGCRSTPQAFIERLMIRLARRGAVVARLKGGDPFVFGRGGEEAAGLRAAAVPVDVVNGVTAGIAAPAALGIPVTHRDDARGVAFITGHAGDEGEPAWSALRATGLTLVIYMGVARVGTLVAGMLDGGYAPETPAAAIQNATLETQREVVTKLADLPAAIVRARIGSPAILVVGEVVRHAEMATRIAAMTGAQALSAAPAGALPGAQGSALRETACQPSSAYPLESAA